MKTMMLTLACVAAVVTGCGTSDGGKPQATSSARKLATTITSDGVHEVGKDIAPGVYTSKSDCVAYSAKTADFDIMDDDADDDAYIASAMPVGSVQRIKLHEGEFFTSGSCSDWTLEDSTETSSADPATLAGGCEILSGKRGAAEQALTFARKKPTADDELRNTLQDQLFTVVVANNRQLSGPAGQLVDFLDDPEAYIDGSKLDSSILRAFSKIRTACEGQSG